MSIVAKKYTATDEYILTVVTESAPYPRDAFCKYTVELYTNTGASLGYGYAFLTSDRTSDPVELKDIWTFVRDLDTIYHIDGGITYFFREIYKKIDVYDSDGFVIDSTYEPVSTTATGLVNSFEEHGNSVEIGSLEKFNISIKKGTEEVSVFLNEDNIKNYKKLIEAKNTGLISVEMDSIILEIVQKINKLDQVDIRNNTNINLIFTNILEEIKTKNNFSHGVVKINEVETFLSNLKSAIVCDLNNVSLKIQNLKGLMVNYLNDFKVTKTQIVYVNCDEPEPPPPPPPPIEMWEYKKEYLINWLRTHKIDGGTENILTQEKTPEVTTPTPVPPETAADIAEYTWINAGVKQIITVRYPKS